MTVNGEWRMDARIGKYRVGTLNAKRKRAAAVAAATTI